MYVCICNAITDSEIRDAADAGITSVEELQDSLGVAVNCGSCADLAATILDAHRDTDSTMTYMDTATDNTGVHRYQPSGAAV